MNETYNTTPEKLLYAQKQFFSKRADKGGRFSYTNAEKAEGCGQSALSPLVSAIAAGNCAILKSSDREELPAL